MQINELSSVEERELCCIINNIIILEDEIELSNQKITNDNKALDSNTSTRINIQQCEENKAEFTMALKEKIMPYQQELTIKEQEMTKVKQEIETIEKLLKQLTTFLKGKFQPH